MKIEKIIVGLVILCFTAFTNTTYAQTCTADAGEPVADPAPLCPGINSVAGSFGLPSGGFTDANGNVDPSVTNYIAFDAAGNLLAVVDEDGIIDLSALNEGETACVYQVTYSQETLNTATIFLDDQLCNVLCDPITGACAGDAIPGFCPGITPTDLAILFNTLDMAFGFDEEDACDLIDNSILTIPFAGVDVEIDISVAGEICADKSTTPYCAALTACAEPTVCDLMAGEPVPPNATVCATGTATMGEPEQGVLNVTNVFGPPTTAVTNNTPVQDYVVVDQANNNAIVSVSDMAILDLTNAAIGDMACVYSFSYYLELVELLAAGINDQICNVLCIPDPNDPLMQQCVADLLPGYMCGQTPTDLAGLLDLLNQLNQAQGLTDVTFDDVQNLCATQMLTINIGNIFGVPGLPDASIDLTLIPGLQGDGFCCDFSNDPHCVTVIDCMVNPPCNLATSGLTISACNTGADPDDPADDTFTFTLNPTGTVLGTNYSISGDVTMMNVAYGTPTTFDNGGAGFPIGTNLNINIVDGTDMNCVLNVVVASPPSCSTNGGGGNTDIPTLSQWGLITLAILMMCFGAIKIGAPALKYDRRLH